MLDKYFHVRCNQNDIENLRRLRERAQEYAGNSYVSDSDVLRFLVSHAIFDKDFGVNCGNWSMLN